MNERRKLSRFQYMAQDVIVNDKEAILMMNGQGQIMSKENFDELVRLGQRFYGSESVAKWIEEQNRLTRWRGHPLLDNGLVDGKFVLSEPRIEEREFKKGLKREWVLKCDWCEQKKMSEPGKPYYRIHAGLTRTKTIAGTCCSKACAENLWYDLLTEWILDEDLKDTFHTDKTIKAKPKGAGVNE